KLVVKDPALPGIAEDPVALFDARDLLLRLVRQGLRGLPPGECVPFDGDGAAPAHESLTSFSRIDQAAATKSSSWLRIRFQCPRTSTEDQPPGARSDRPSCSSIRDHGRPASCRASILAAIE